MKTLKMLLVALAVIVYGSAGAMNSGLDKKLSTQVLATQEKQEVVTVKVDEPKAPVVLAKQEKKKAFVAQQNTTDYESLVGMVGMLAFVSVLVYGLGN